MPKLYFCIGSFYNDPISLMQHIVASDLPSYSMLVNYQRGPEREIAGFARIYNNLLKCAFADPICERAWIMGDDILPMGNCLRDTEACLMSDPTIGIVFPVEAWAEPGSEPLSGRTVTIVPPNGEKIDIDMAINSGLVDFEQLFAGFACACISRLAFETIGLMDESIGLGYAEDLDYGIRCWKAGFRIVNYRRAWFWHARGATYERLIKEGKLGKNAPYEAAERAKQKWPWLWNGEPFEETMTRMKNWYAEARGI